MNVARLRGSSAKTAGAPVWVQVLLVLVVGGLSGTLAIVALRSSSQGSIFAVAAVAALAALAVVFGLGEVRRPLLAILAFSLPLHLDIYLGKFPLSFAYGPSASLGRLASNDLVLAALLFLWLGETAIGRQRRIEFFPRTSAPALLFIGMGVLSIAFAQEPRLSIYQVLELGKGFLLFLYVANRVQDGSDLKWLLAGLLAAVLFQGGLGLYQAVMQRPLGLDILGERLAVHHHILVSQVTVRPSGTLWHPNHLAMFLELVLPVVGAMLLAPSTRTHGQSGISWRWRLAAALALVVGLATVVLTLSRGTWLSLGVAAAILVWWGVRSQTLPRLATAVGLAGLLAILVLLNALTGNVIVERLTGPDLAQPNPVSR